MCGIFGQISKVPKTINKIALNILGAANDARGGDSCGIFIDGKIDIGIQENKLYSNFYKNSTLLKESTKATVLLGHCRKASVGTITAETAQPIVITNEIGETEFVLIHNGTILNWKELAKEYLKDVPEYYTDSYVMAYIMYYHGFEVLSKYEGAAAFVIVDYRKDREFPTTYFFKGASKFNNYAHVISEERPLYLHIDNDKNIIKFSSIQKALELSINNGGEIISAVDNSLYTLHKGIFTNITEYSRKDRIQTMAVTQLTYSSSKPQYSRYIDWDMENEYATHKIKSTKDTYVNTNIKICNFVKFIYDRQKTNPKNITTLILKADGKYHYKNDPATGIFKIKEGSIKNQLYLFNGYILSGKAVYNIIKDIYDDACLDMPVTKDEIITFLGEIFYKHIITPYYDTITEKVYDNNGELYTGEFINLWSIPTHAMRIIEGVATYQYYVANAVKTAYLEKLLNIVNAPLSKTQIEKLENEFNAIDLK